MANGIAAHNLSLALPDRQYGMIASYLCIPKAYTKQCNAPPETKMHLASKRYSNDERHHHHHHHQHHDRLHPFDFRRVVFARVEKIAQRRKDT